MMPNRNRKNVLALAALLACALLSLIACSPAAPAAEVKTATPAAEPPTPVPTFTPTPATPSPTPTATPRPTDTPAPVTPTPTSTATPAATATSTAAPATATATRRPPTATPVPVPPTEAPKPSVDFKVVESRLLTMAENKGCRGDHNFFITILNKDGQPLDGVIVQRRYLSQVEVPPSGTKGPGKTEDEIGKGNAFRVLRDTTGKEYSSDWTREMSAQDIGISNAELIAGGYCTSDADCNARKTEGSSLCFGHYSYYVTFQKTW